MADYTEVPGVDYEALDAKVAKTFKNYKTTGGVLIVARDGEIVYRQNYGYAFKRDQELVDDNTYFRIASVTKLVSAIHMMQLVEQGLLDLDEDISTYLGYEVINPFARTVPITLRTLMTHTSSLNSNMGYSNESASLYSLIAYEAGHRANFHEYAPGTVYKYSNFGAGIMGSLLEAVTGKTINQSAADDLFAPLGIDAAYYAGLLMQPERVAQIYNAAGGTVTARRKYVEAPFDITPDPDRHYRITVGSIFIKPYDLYRLGQMLLNGGTIDGVQVLKPETVEEMMASQKGRGVVTIDSPYGLCINRVDNLLPDRLVYGHQGMVEESLCNLYFEPQSGLVFVLVTNGSSTNMSDHICKLSRAMFGIAWETFAEQ